MRKIKIIIVDDDDLCLLIAKKLVSAHLPKDLDYNLKSLNDPLKGLELATQYLSQRRDSSLNEMIFILLDISMPVMNGWSFLENLNLIDPDNEIKVFMHSSSLDESDQERAMAYERVLHYFNKPMTPQKVAILYSKITDLSG